MDGSEYGSGHIPKRGIPTMIPYGTTGSGHAGNATSRERQEKEDAAGLTGKRQRAVFEAVELSARYGVTALEMEQLLGVGHGQASSALSHLHRAGRIRRITERRNKQEVYVLAVHVGERKESPYNPRPERKHPKFHSDRTVLEAMKIAGIAPTRYESIRKFLENLP